MLTKAQLRRIQNIIRKRFLSFTYETLGEHALTEDELKVLKDAGLLRRSVRSFYDDGTTLGKVVSILPRAEAAVLTYSQVRLLAKRKDLVIGKTAVERSAERYAAEHAGQYIKGIGDDLIKEVGALSARAGMEALRAVQDETVGAISKRKTISELKTALYHAIDNKNRDWHRVAHTELNNSIQNGIYHEIRSSSDEGSGQLVYKRPASTACPYCKKLYLQSDGVTPKIFRLRDLADSNVGRKAKDWLPTVGSVHPWCQCQLHPVLEGFDFEKKRIILQPFERGGRSYKRGQIISDEEYASFTDEQKSKTGIDAVLAHTGETAKLTTEKSLVNYPISDEMDDCTCEY